MRLDEFELRKGHLECLDVVAVLHFVETLGRARLVGLLPRARPTRETGGLSTVGVGSRCARSKLQRWLRFNALAHPQAREGALGVQQTLMGASRRRTRSSL